MLTPEGFRAKSVYTEIYKSSEDTIANDWFSNHSCVEILIRHFEHETNIRIEIDELESSEYDVTKIKNSAFKRV